MNCSVNKALVGGFKKGEMAVICADTDITKSLLFNNQQIAFMLAFSQAKAGRNVKLSKENGQWLVKILAD